jgi:transposase
MLLIANVRGILDKGVSNRIFAQQFGRSISTAGNMIKNSNMILKV